MMMMIFDEDGEWSWIVYVISVHHHLRGGDHDMTIDVYQYKTG